LLHLKLLTIDGFLSYGISPVVIPLNLPGITSIKGPTGSGKSTIFDAVFYLLTGQTFRKKTRVSYLINQVTNKGYDITLTYELDSDEHKIQEIRGRGEASGLFFWKNGKDLSKKDPRDTRREITAAQGLTPNDLRSIAFTGQEQQHTLIYGTSGDRGKELIQIFSLGRYDGAIEKCETDVKKLATSQKKIQDSLGEQQNHIDAVQRSLAEITIEIVDASTERLESIRYNIQDKEAKLLIIRKREASVREELGKIQALQQRNNSVLRVQEEMWALKKELASLPPVSKSSVQLTTDISELKIRRATLATNLKYLQDALSEIRALGDKCPINQKLCPVNVPSFYKEERVSDYDTRIQQGVTNVAGIRQSISLVESELLQAQQIDKVARDISGKEDYLKNGTNISEVPDSSEKSAFIDKCVEAQDIGAKQLINLRSQSDEIVKNLALRDQAMKHTEVLQASLQRHQEIVQWPCLFSKRLGCIKLIMCLSC